MDGGLDIQGILKANLLGVSPDIARVSSSPVDRELFTMAPNAIEWSVRPEYLNSPSLYDFQMSYQTIRDFFELRCPICNEGGTEEGQPGYCWGRSRESLESEVLLVWSNEYLEEVCPKCRTTRSELFDDGLVRNYNQLHLVSGMRSGKTVTGSFIGTFLEHAWYTLAHTQPNGIPGYLGAISAVQYAATFLASSAKQGKETLWATYTGLRKSAPWFQRYVPWIKEQERLQPSNGMRKWTYTENELIIENQHPHVNLVISVENSNSGSSAGRTRAWVVLDELARMKQTDSAQSAMEVYRTQENSLRTVRSRVKLFGCAPWLGSMLSVTSPLRRNDWAMKLLQLSGQVTDLYARKYATWEFNPKEPREHFEDAFRKDPVGTARDFGANPPGAEHPYIHDEPRWANLSIGLDRVPQVTFDYFTRYDARGQPYVAAKVASAVRRLDHKQPTFVVFDAGKNFDCFSGAAAHAETYIARDGSAKKVTVFDWVMRVVPVHGTEIWFQSVVDIMLELRKYQVTSFVAFDRWESTNLIQQVRDLGVMAEQQTLRPPDFTAFRLNCFEGAVQMLPPAEEDVAWAPDGMPVLPFEWLRPQPNMAAESVAIAEAVELEEDPNTRAVVNPDKGVERGWHSDDTIRCCVHVHKLVQRSDFVERWDDNSVRARRKRQALSSERVLTGPGTRPQSSPPQRLVETMRQYSGPLGRLVRTVGPTGDPSRRRF